MRSGSCGSCIQSLFLLSKDTISRIAGMEARPSLHEPLMAPVLEQKVTVTAFVNEETGGSV